MVIVNRLKMSIPQQRALEMTEAEVAKQKADIDYIAMMCDVDIPTEDGGMADGTLTEI